MEISIRMNFCCVVWLSLCPSCYGVIEAINTVQMVNKPPVSLAIVCKQTPATYIPYHLLFSVVQCKYSDERSPTHHMQYYLWGCQQGYATCIFHLLPLNPPKIILSVGLMTILMLRDQHIGTSFIILISYNIIQYDPLLFSV